MTNKGGKCFICGAEKMPMVNAKFKEDDGTITDKKVCTKCWKDLWGSLLKGKEVKIE